MFARLLLLIAIVTGLMAGPTALGGWNGTSVAKKCECCVMPPTVACCEAPSAPPQRVPVSSSNSQAVQLKLALEPLVTVLPARLCVKPPVMEMPAREIGLAPVSPLIDRLCIRLI